MGILKINKQQERFASLSAFPATGNSTKLYLANDTGTLYQWDGNSYDAIAGGGGGTVDWGDVGGTITNQADLIDYINTKVAGLWDYRGVYDASTNAFPSSGGSGTAGAILKADVWVISVAGTLGGSSVNVGDIIIAEIDTPGSTAANWSIIEGNLGYTPENISNKDTDGTLAANSDTKYPSQKAVKTYTDAKVADAINNGTTTIAPSQNAVFDALALKQIIPTAAKITVLGSSVADGYGVTAGQGWFELLAANLTGYTFSNVASNGLSSGDWVGTNFNSDLVPANPDFVIIALGLWNDVDEAGQTHINQAIFDAYISNIKKLIKMCDDKGYRPILASCYPNNNWNAADYVFVKQFNLWAETESQVPYFNYLGATDDGTGKWRSGMNLTADALHPNAIGHAAMYGCIPFTLFENIPLDVMPNLGRSERLAGVKVGSDTSTGIIKYTPDRTLYSFTAMARVRRPASGASANKDILTFNQTSNPIKIQNPTDALILTNGTPIVSSSVLSSDNNWHHIAAAFDYHTNLWSLYIDGVLIGTGTQATGTITSISFGGNAGTPANNAVGYEFQDAAIYRTALNVDQIVKCYENEYAKGSCEIFCPLDDNNVAQNISFYNLATCSAKLINESAAITRTTGDIFYNIVSKGVVAGTNITFAVVDGKLEITAAGGGGGTPGGANTYIQYNDAGAFGGEAAFAYNKSTNTLLVDNIDSSGLTASLAAKANKAKTINEQTGTTYTFVATDVDKIVTADNASAQTFTIPQNSTAAIAVGESIEFVSKGAGEVTLIGEGSDIFYGNTKFNQGQSGKITKLSLASTVSTWQIDGGSFEDTWQIPAARVPAVPVASASYVIVAKAKKPFIITGFCQAAASLGTAGTYTIDINGTAVTGLNAVTNTTTLTETPATAANAVPIGGKVSITFSGDIISPVGWYGDLSITHKF